MHVHAAGTCTLQGGLLLENHYRGGKPELVLQVAREMSSLPMHRILIENLIIPCVDFDSQTGTIVNVNIQKSTITVFQDMSKISSDFRNCISAFVRAVADDDEIEWGFEAFGRPPCNAKWELTLLLHQISLRSLWGVIYFKICSNINKNLQ